MSGWTEEQYERWGEYPLESHDGHETKRTEAPNVSYCYGCNQHYRRQ